MHSGLVFFGISQYYLYELGKTPPKCGMLACSVQNKRDETKDRGEKMEVNSDHLESW